MLYFKLEHINKGKAWRHVPLIAEMVTDLTDYLYARRRIQTGHYFFGEDDPNLVIIPIIGPLEDTQAEILKVIKDSWICAGWEVTIIEGDNI